MSHDLGALRRLLEARSTDDLVAIVGNDDREEWRPEALEMARSILGERGISPTDVGRPLAQIAEGDGARDPQPVEGPLGTPPLGYSRVARALGVADAERVGELLHDEEMPFFLDARNGRRSEISVYVPSQHAFYVGMLLERAGLIPPQPPLDDAAVGIVGGPCPACGSPVPAGSAECPNCRLGFA